MQPYQYLILAWWNLCQTSDLQNHEIINLCYLKPLNIYKFVTEAIENYYQMYASLLSVHAFFLYTLIFTFNAK